MYGTADNELRDGQVAVENDATQENSAAAEADDERVEFDTDFSAESSITMRS